MTPRPAIAPLRREMHNGFAVGQKKRARPLAVPSGFASQAASSSDYTLFGATVDGPPHMTSGESVSRLALLTACWPVARGVGRALHRSGFCDRSIFWSTRG